MKEKQLQLQQLRYFVALADTMNFGRAAENAGISQSALTQSMASLEASLNARLFNRDRFGTSLTPAGHLVLARARAVVAETRGILLELKEWNGDARPRVNLGVGKTIVETFLPEIIDTFVTRHPEAVVHTTEGWSPELFRGVLAGDLDVVISTPLPDVVVPPDLRQEKICQQTEAVIIGKQNRFFEKEDVSLADLSEERWLLPPDGSRRLNHIRGVFMASDVEPPRRIVRSDSVSLGRDLVRRGFVAHGILEVLSGQMNQYEYRVLNFPTLTFLRPVFLTIRGRTRLQKASQDFCTVARDIASRAIGSALPGLTDPSFLKAG